MKRLALAGLLLALACGEERRTTVAPPLAPVVAKDQPDTPADATAFLAQLLPLPGGALVVVYEVTGPGGLTGTLELMMREGGLRRENWTLEITTATGTQTVRGTTIQTARWAWTAADDGPGSRTPMPLEDLATEYFGLPEKERARIVKGLATWHADLQAARAEHPGETREVLGQKCLWTRVAAQTLCVWEEAGVPLRYEGPAFRAQAVRIDRAPTLTDDAFQLPAVAEGAALVAADASMAMDPKQSLAELADGNYAGLALVLQPGFRPPAPLRASSEAP